MKSIIERIRNKIYLLIGRAVLVALKNTDKNQKLQVKGLYNETITDVDRIQEYGLETYPIIDSNTEVVILFPNGNRNNGIAVAVGNRESRPKDLALGDVRLYDNKGNEVDLSVLGITLKTGDASLWLPNVLAADPLTGLPHGGPTAGIVKLKGA